MALLPDPEGQLHLIRNNRKNTRKDVSCRSLYMYLMEKYHLSEGEHLSAWHDENGALLFGWTPAEVEAGGFHPGFRRVSIPIEDFTYCSLQLSGGVLVLNQAAARCLGPRVAAYVNGAFFCLVPDPNGALEVKLHPNGGGSIASTQLAMCLRQRLGGQVSRIYARICESKVYFSNNMPDKRQNFNAYMPIQVESGSAGGWVTLTDSAGLRFSAGLADSLGSYVNLYERGDVMAFVGEEEEGQFHIERRVGCRTARISSVQLPQYLSRRYQCQLGYSFFAAARGKVVFFSDHLMSEGELTRSGMRNSGICAGGKLFATLTPPRKLYLSKLAAVALGGRFSAYYSKDAVLLRSDPGGRFHKDLEGGGIHATDLIQFLDRKLPGRSGRKLCAAIIVDGVILSAEPMEPAEIEAAEREARRVPDRMFYEYRCIANFDRKRNRLRLSKQAGIALGDRVEAYAADHILLLANDPKGRLQIREAQQRYVSSVEVSRAIDDAFQCGDRARLKGYIVEEGLILSDEQGPPKVEKVEALRRQAQAATKPKTGQVAGNPYWERAI